MNAFNRTDEELRRILRPTENDRAPDDFANRVMGRLRSEAEKETASPGMLLREYLPYAAAVIAVGFALFFGWQYVPWLGNLISADGRNAGETILMLQTVLESFRKVFSIFSSSNISVIFVLSVVIYLLADRLYNHYLHTRKTNTLRMLL